MVQSRESGTTAGKHGEELSDKEIQDAQRVGKTAVEGVEDANVDAMLDEIDEVLKDNDGNTTDDIATIDVDAILDEIDEVLEPNAAAYVQGFIQRGGQ